MIRTEDNPIRSSELMIFKIGHNASSSRDENVRVLVELAAARLFVTRSPVKVDDYPRSTDGGD